MTWPPTGMPSEDRTAAASLAVAAGTGDTFRGGRGRDGGRPRHHRVVVGVLVVPVLPAPETERREGGAHQGETPVTRTAVWTPVMKV